MIETKLLAEYGIFGHDGISVKFSEKSTVLPNFRHNPLKIP
jgi:hypothetical protein